MTRVEVTGRLSFHHLCIEVDDIEAAAHALATTVAAGPFYLIDHAPFDEIEYAHGPISWSHSLAFGALGSLLFELHQTHSIDPPDALGVLGRRPIGHIAFLVDDVHAESARLEADGAPRVLFGRNGPVSLAYHEVPHAGLVEIIQGREFVPFWDGVLAQSAGWDRKRPLRPAAELT